MSAKDAIRKLVPQALRTAIYERRLSRRFRALRREWLDLHLTLAPAAPRRTGLNRLLIFPGDLGEPFGSVGDEAMITASRQTAQSINPDVETLLLVEGEQAAAAARTAGMRPIDIWGRADFLHAFAAMIEKEQVDAVVANGADIIDGVYGIVVPASMAYAADIAVRLGRSATILGSSFNTRPRAELAQAFDDVDGRVDFCLRDQPSLDRFSRFTSARATLVADSAFSLQPTEPDPAVIEWAAARRAAGRRVIGFNLHPMLVKEDPDKVAALIESAVAALPPLTRDRQVSWLLIAHDRRIEVGDLVILQAVHDRLAPVLGDDLRLVNPATVPATGLKGIAGALDGVVTGRMHLSIGALGKGVPVLCVAYQDKFEGLFIHFGLPPAMLMAVADASRADQLEARLLAFVDSLPELRRTVATALPEVLASSRRNYAGLDRVASAREALAPAGTVERLSEKGML